MVRSIVVVGGFRGAEMAVSSKGGKARFWSKDRDDHSKGAELLPDILMRDLVMFPVRWGATIFADLGLSGRVIWSSLRSCFYKLGRVLKQGI